MNVSTEALRQAPFLAGSVVRTGKNADVIDGIKPRLVVEPHTPEKLASILAGASREQLTVVFRGGGTKLGWGRIPKPVDLLISTRALNRVLAHEHADLTATIEAGATLDELAQALGRHRQWLPLDRAGDAATVGGAIATNDSGPLRHRYGTPRDLLIGVTLATADGRLVKAGGTVVKNVAGYDLGKLVSGSFGSLAAVVSATFKLLPMPVAWYTLSAAFDTADTAARAAAAVNDSQLEPISLELHAARVGGAAASYRLLVRFATAPAAARAQVEQARTLIGNGEIIDGDAEASLWRRYQARASASAGTVIRVSCLPAMLAGVLALVDDIGHTGGSIELALRAGIGAGQLRIDGSADWQASVVTLLRGRPNLFRHVTIQDAPPAVKEAVDAFGPPGAASRIGAMVKHALDPADILNAGRGPI